MSPLEAVRLIWARVSPSYDGMCYACHSTEPGDAADPVRHAPDCPWLAMPQIVAGLEAVEVLTVYVDAEIEDWGVDATTICTDGPEWQTFIAALKGQPA